MEGVQTEEFVVFGHELSVKMTEGTQEDPLVPHLGRQSG